MTDSNQHQDVAAELTAAMRQNIQDMAPMIGPRTRFTPMLNEYGAVEAWRRLKSGSTTGFTALWEAGRLDLSLEALVLENAKYRTLFRDDELAEMRDALHEHGYVVKMRSVKD